MPSLSVYLSGNILIFLKQCTRDTTTSNCAYERLHLKATMPPPTLTNDAKLAAVLSELRLLQNAYNDGHILSKRINDGEKVRTFPEIVQSCVDTIEGGE